MDGWIDGCIIMQYLVWMCDAFITIYKSPNGMNDCVGVRSIDCIDASSYPTMKLLTAFIYPFS